jgi:hypothetical protein
MYLLDLYFVTVTNYRDRDHCVINSNFIHPFSIVTTL